MEHAAGFVVLSFAVAVLMGFFFLGLGDDVADWVTWLLCWFGLNFVVASVVTHRSGASTGRDPAPPSRSDA